MAWVHSDDIVTPAGWCVLPDELEKKNLRPQNSQYSNLIELHGTVLVIDVIGAWCWHKGVYFVRSNVCMGFMGLRMSM